MGIRGLTTFIANSGNKYLENYELHDTQLVIDGYNIASQLYKWHCTKNDCFGGDYDKYAKVVYNFFDLLKTCNVTSLVVFDGAYEDRKLKTVFSRLKSKIQLAKNLNSVTQGSVQVFPLLLKECFTDIVLKLGVTAVRCDFEADYDMACIARLLNCPLLSYDSDFYVFDVLYIPFSTFYLCVNKIKHSKPVQYGIRCQIYRIEKFVSFYGGLRKENLPLMGILLGNDYISKRNFSKFFDHLKLAKKKEHQSEQQRKIIAVIKWLQTESYESAVKKILSRLKAPERVKVAKQIRDITESYTCNSTTLLQYCQVELINENESLPVYLVGNEIIDENGYTNSEASSISEESTSEDFSVEVPDSKLEENIPDWFHENFRKCLYPSGFLDILVRNTYFCTPQVENYANVNSHTISLKIISALHKILTSNKQENLVYVARSENGKIGRYSAPLCPLNLPDLNSLRSLNAEGSSKVLMSVLELPCEINKILVCFPNSWQLYILSLIFWTKNVNPKNSSAYVYTTVLCALVLNRVDEVIGFYRASTKFASKFTSELDRFNLQCSRSDDDVSSDLIPLLLKIDRRNCLFCLKSLISYFQMEPKMRTHAKLFDIYVVDAFAQFQSAIMHIKYLNILLNKPFDDVIISNFYDGTFLYNMCSNLLTRTDLNAYLSILLKDSPQILQCFNIIIDSLYSVVKKDVHPVAVTKRKRRRKKHIEKNIENISYDAEDSVSENVLDANNRFSILSVA